MSEFPHRLIKAVRLTPPINRYQKVKGYFEECANSGFKFAVGGKIIDSDGYFVPVTLVDNPPELSRIVQEEPFGPILPLLKWSDEADVIRRASESSCRGWVRH